MPPPAAPNSSPLPESLLAPKPQASKLANRSLPMNGRLIAIGDIHGCHLEFAELVERLELARDDRVVLLGDLVNRGPDSCRVIDLARQIKAVSLLGNHELRLLKHRQT